VDVFFLEAVSSDEQLVDAANVVQRALKVRPTSSPFAGPARARPARACAFRDNDFLNGYTFGDVSVDADKNRAACLGNGGSREECENEKGGEH
jgi:hypothetical protein